MRLNIRRIGVLIILISLNSLFCFSQSQISKKIKTTKLPRLYISLGADDTTTTKVKKICNNNVVNININVNTDTLSYNKELLLNSIVKQIPLIKSKEIVVLDWEGAAFEVLAKNDTNSKEYKKVFDQFVSAYNLVKSKRPNVTCGFYGLPFRYYWKRDYNWKQKCLNLNKLLSHFDAIFPSLYVTYKDNVDVKEVDNINYIKDNVDISLELSYKIQKPVYFYVWHRYHDSNSKFGLQLISENYFGDQIKTIFQSAYKTKKADGIIWWSAECYFRNVLKKKKSTVELTNCEFSDTSTTLKYLQIINENL